jgi:hypothetical protein
MDSLAAHPDALTGFSRLLDSLAAHVDALGGFSACLPLSLDALVAQVSRMRSKFIFLLDLDSHILTEYCRRMLLLCRFVF